MPSTQYHRKAFVTQDTNQDVLFSAENLELKPGSHTSLVAAVERKVMQCRHPGQHFQPRRMPLPDTVKQFYTTHISILRNLPLSSS